jgi:hypothetical protein
LAKKVALACGLLICALIVVKIIREPWT